MKKYLNDEKTNAAKNNKLFKKLNHENTDFYEIEFAKREVGHKEPVIVRFFCVSIRKTPNAGTHYNFFINFCDMNKFEEFEMDRGSLHLALAEK